MIPTFTVVCVYNSEATLERYLRPGLSRQTHSYELRLVDNTTGRFSNAADALNHGARDTSTNYLVFIHQDVELLESTFFQEAARHLSQLPNLGIAGIVGAELENGATVLRGRCLQGDANREGFTPGYESPMAVQTIDEQLMLVRTDWFRQQSFDPQACPAWDLYGVEYSLSCAKRGRDVRVLPLAVRHASWGKLRRAYFETLMLVQHKHPDVPTLCTTCGAWPQRRSALGHLFAHKCRSAYNLARHQVTKLTTR